MNRRSVRSGQGQAAGGRFAWFFSNMHMTTAIELGFRSPLLQRWCRGEPAAFDQPLQQEIGA